jgi:hypothetical protein
MRNQLTVIAFLILLATPVATSAAEPKASSIVAPDAKLEKLFGRRP